MGNKFNWSRVNKNNLLAKRGYDYASSDVPQRDSYAQVPVSLKIVEKQVTKGTVIKRRANKSLIRNNRDKFSHGWVENRDVLEKRLNKIVEEVELLSLKNPDIEESKILRKLLIKTITRIVDLDPSRKDAPLREDIACAFIKLQTILENRPGW